MLYKNLEEKYTQLEKQVQGVMRDAQSEITSLRAKLQALQKDMELEKRKTHDLAEQLQEKGRQFSKLQVIYDKLKRRTLVPAMQQTVQNNVGNAVPNVGSGNPISGMRQGGVSNQSGMPRMYGENILSNNNLAQISQQWNTISNQENNYRDPYMLYRTQHSSTQQDYHSIREQTPAGINNSYATGSAGRMMMDGNEMNAFQPKGSFTQTRTPFAMASNPGVKMAKMAPTKGIG